MSILLFGDSHTDIFGGMQDVIKFNTAQCKSSIMTIHRFTDAGDTDLWELLDPWFKNNQSSSLVISVGEIDIRAHFWRHIPRYYQDSQSILDYINSIALKFYNSLVNAFEKYNLERIVVWGAPVAGDGAHYNFKVPFSGSAQTRNILIHLWNRSFVNITNNDSRISFATAYYNFVDPVTYSTVIPSPSHDGVHWRNEYGPKFWEKLIIPALSSRQNFVAGGLWEIMSNNIIDITETISSGTYQYDTWVRTDQAKDAVGKKQIVVNKIPYSFITADQRKLLPDQYNELTLKNLNIK